MLKLRYALLFTAIFFAAGCAAKSASPLVEIRYGEFVEKVSKANAPAVCAYKGRIAVSFSSEGKSSGSFSGILRKTCGEAINLSIFGPFNTIFAEIGYKDGEVSVKAADPDTEENIKSFAGDSLEGFVSYMRYPLYMPDENGKIAVKDGYYIYDAGYDAGNVLIYIDKNFRIIKYAVEQEQPFTIEYSFWDAKGPVSEIRLKRGGEDADIKLLNADGWSGSEGGTM